MAETSGPSLDWLRQRLAAPDPDLVRAMVEGVVAMLMGAEADAPCGAGDGERHAERGHRTRSQIRARVEHVFGAQSNDLGGTLVRSIGSVRVTARIGLQDLADDRRRLVPLERLAAAA
jgi:hypothetical protein